MSNQSHRESVKDRAKKRREYVQTKLNAYGLAAVAFSVAVPCLLVLLYILLGTMLFMNPDLLWVLASESFDGKSPEGIGALDLWQWRAGLAVVTVASTCMVVGGVRLFRAKVRQIRTLPYVPPVQERLNDLTAEEVLLRGSNEPTATPEELLRAAQEATADPAGELLRVPAERKSRRPHETDATATRPGDV